MTADQLDDDDPFPVVDTFFLDGQAGLPVTLILWFPDIPEESDVGPLLITRDVDDVPMTRTAVLALVKTLLGFADRLGG